MNDVTYQDHYMRLFDADEQCLVALKDSLGVGQVMQVSDEGEVEIHMGDFTVKARSIHLFRDYELN